MRFQIIHIILLFTTAAVFTACENDIKEVENLNSKNKIATEEAHNIEAYLSEAGKVKGKLTSPLMYRYQPTGQASDTPYTEFPKTLHIDFYNDSLVKESQVDAKYGKYRAAESKVLLRDSVVVINVLKKDTLTTDELWWDQNTQKFYTSKPARYSQHDGFVNFGKNGLEAKQDLSDLVFYNNSGTLPVPKEDSSHMAVDSSRSVTVDSTKKAIH